MNSLSSMKDEDLFNFTKYLRITPLVPVLPSTRSVIIWKINKTIKERIKPGLAKLTLEKEIREYYNSIYYKGEPMQH